MTYHAFEWTWHNQCGQGLTEAGALAAVGIFVAIALVVISLAWLWDRR